MATILVGSRRAVPVTYPDHGHTSPGGVRPHKRGTYERRRNSGRRPLFRQPDVLTLIPTGQAAGRS